MKERSQGLAASLIAGPGPALLALAFCLVVRVEVRADDPTGRTDPVAEELAASRGALAFERGRYAEAIEFLGPVRDGSGATDQYRALSQMGLEGRGDGAAGGEVPGESVSEHSLVHEASRVDRLPPPTPANPASPGWTPGSQWLEAASEVEQPGPGWISAGPEPARGGYVPATNAGIYREGWGQPVSDVSADRRWTLSILTGFEYDSNVALAPFIPFNALGAFNLPSSRWTLSSFGEYRFIQREDAVLGLIGSTYDTFQLNLEEFNFQDYMGGAYSNVARGNWILGGRYEFHESLLDQKQFTREHRFVPNLTYREGTFGHTLAYYEYDNLDVDGFALIPAQVRTGTIHAAGATQAVYLFNGAGRLFLGYRYEQAFTLGSDFDRRTNMLTARIEAPVPFQSVAFLEFRQFFDAYSNPNSLDFFGRPRSDRRIEARAGIQKFLTERLSVRVEYTYANNDSNVENLFGTSFYSYDRHILSTLLIVDF